MIARVRETVARGIAQLRDRPQLWYTMALAAAIVIAFLYISGRFILVARDAQDELTNVRVGSIQDAFVPLARHLAQDSESLRVSMREIRALNPTIKDFFVVRQSEAGWRVLVSADSEYEGSDFLGHDFLLSLSQSDPTRSFTVQELQGSVRYFRTARAILDASSTPIGIAVTRQEQSQADARIAQSIQSGMLVLVGMLAVLLLLFFRHARIIDYATLYRRLKGVDQLKDDFIAMASHELRTPLTAIRGYAEILRDTGTTAPQRLQALERIDISARSLDTLIADMLDVSRIEQGRMLFTVVDVDPRKVFADVCTLLLPVAQSKGLVLSFEDLAEGHIQLDVDKLRQVALNLVGNAIKYTPHGSVSVSGRVEGGRYVIRVSDTGIGMSSEVREQLFGKFYRAAGAAVRAQTGTGLGLWITKQLVEKMGGAITVESIEGVGSHFVVSFPCAEGSK